MVDTSFLTGGRGKCTVPHQHNPCVCCATMPDAAPDAGCWGPVGNQAGRRACNAMQCNALLQPPATSMGNWVEVSIDMEVSHVGSQMARKGPLWHALWQVGPNHCATCKLQSTHNCWVLAGGIGIGLVCSTTLDTVDGASCDCLLGARAKLLEQEQKQGGQADSSPTITQGAYGRGYIVYSKTKLHR